MDVVANVIREHHAEIVAAWTESAQRAASARGLSGPEFQNILPTYLSSLAEAPGDASRQRELLASHVSTRLRQGFDLAEVQEEIVLLGRSVARFWEDRPTAEQPVPADLERFHDSLQRASLIVLELFQEHLRCDEQQEKRFLRLLQTVADEALRDPVARLRERLGEIAGIVMEAIRAQTCAILLFERGKPQATFTAYAGVVDPELERYTAMVAETSLAGAIIRGERPTSVSDAETTELEVGESLRRSGIHSLLGMRLPPRSQLIGVLYVGLGEKRPFSEREVRRLEALGDRLTLQLDNVLLVAALRERVDELVRERDLRDLFVSILAHDLRGPLSTAKIGIELLMRQQESSAGWRDQAVRIARNLDRTERMVRDLLDVNRVRAGQPLPLRLDDCDLSLVAQGAVEELRSAYGERFRLEGDAPVRGIWSAEELHRALWNLGANAAKYGASDQPITVRVERTATGARVSVHNVGPAIPAAQREHLFDAFVRPVHASRAGGGWGLGLALVKACAEAHGGRVTLDSTDEAGTTFTIELPEDARAPAARA